MYEVVHISDRHNGFSSTTNVEHRATAIDQNIAYMSTGSRYVQCGYLLEQIEWKRRVSQRLNLNVVGGGLGRKKEYSMTDNLAMYCTHWVLSYNYAYAEAL